jgi:hypothetical protein
MISTIVQIVASVLGAFLFALASFFNSPWLQILSCAAAASTIGGTAAIVFDLSQQPVQRRREMVEMRRQVRTVLPVAAEAQRVADDAEIEQIIAAIGVTP